MDGNEGGSLGTKSVKGRIPVYSFDYTLKVGSNESYNFFRFFPKLFQFQ